MSFSELFQIGSVGFVLSVPVGFLFGLVFGFFKRLRTFVGAERFITSTVLVAFSFGVTMVNFCKGF